VIRGKSVAAVMPALDEQGVIGPTLAAVPGDLVDRVWVADNGSTDATAAEAARHGARVVREPRRGYGSACQAAIRAMQRDDPPDLVVFLDADGSQDLDDLPAVLTPLARGRADLVIGVRRPRDLPIHVAVGNRLACAILRLLTGHPFRDLGPFRAVRFDALLRLELRDPDYGWNVEMQARAVAEGLRIVEVPVGHRPRRSGRSKISGSVRGTVRAGTKILWTAVLEGAAVRRAHARRDPHPL
jgi:hypothetical protein